MPKAESEPLASLPDHSPTSGDGSLRPQLPAWRSFASWAGESSELAVESGISIRVSPSWYTPRWSRLEALSIDTRNAGRAEDEEGGDAAPRSRWTALRRTNHLVASVTR